VTAEELADVLGVREAVHCPKCGRNSHLNCTTSGHQLGPGRFACICPACGSEIGTYTLEGGLRPSHPEEAQRLSREKRDEATRLESERQEVAEQEMRVVTERLHSPADIGSIDDVAQALGGTDTATREKAVKILGASSDGRAAAPLIQALGEGFTNNDRRLADKATKALTALASSIPDALIPGLVSEISEVRWTVAQLLGDYGRQEAVPALKNALNDPDDGVREAASVALERLGSDDAV